MLKFYLALRCVYQFFVTLSLPEMDPNLTTQEKVVYVHTIIGANLYSLLCKMAIKVSLITLSGIKLLIKYLNTLGLDTNSDLDMTGV